MPITVPSIPLFFTWQLLFKMEAASVYPGCGASASSAPYRAFVWFCFATRSVVHSFFFFFFPGESSFNTLTKNRRQAVRQMTSCANLYIHWLAVPFAYLDLLGSFHTY